MGLLFDKIRAVFSHYVYLIILAAIVIVPPIAYSIFQPDPLGSRRGNPFFSAKIPTSIVLPECGERESYTCSHVVLIIADAPKRSYPLLPVPHEIIRLLPRALLSSARAAFRSDPQGICSASQLAAELETAQQKSEEFGGAGFVSAVSKASSTCLSFDTLTTPSWPRILLIWNEGRITGWLNCSVDESRLIGCSLDLPSQVQNSVQSAGSIAQFSTSMFVAPAVPRLLRNFGDFEIRIYEIASRNSKIEFNTSLPGNIILWDDETYKLLETTLEE